MMKKYLFFIILTIFFVFPEKNQATTYYVPDNFSTIQAAANYSSLKPGDKVIVKTGTYWENVDINFLVILTTQLFLKVWREPISKVWNLTHELKLMLII